MNYWVDYLVRHEQMIDRRAEAAQYRMVRQATSAVRDRTAICCQVLAAVGRRLTRWGHRLQAQYGA